MAGNKYKCLDCKAEVWRPRKGPCFVCGGDNVVDARFDNAEKPCAECRTLFKPKHGREVVCSPKCRRARDNRWDRENRAKYAKPKSTDMRVAELHKRAPVPSAGLGPSEAPRPTHVCAGYYGHKCEVRTANRRCPKCKAMHLWLNGVEGAYEPTVYSAGSCSIDAMSF